MAHQADALAPASWAARMTGDLLEWARTHARRSDPGTSHEAARRSRGLAARQHALILACMSDGVWRAAEQIGDAIGLDHVSVNRRLPELVAQAKLEPTEERHRNRSGRLAVRYRVCHG